MSTSDSALSLDRLARLAVGEDPTRIKEAVSRYRAYEQKGLIQLERAPGPLPLPMVAKFRTGRSSPSNWMSERKESDSLLDSRGRFKSPVLRATDLGPLHPPPLLVSPQEAAKIAPLEEALGHWRPEAWKFCGGLPEVNDWVNRKSLEAKPQEYGLALRYQGSTRGGVSIMTLIKEHSSHGLSAAIDSTNGRTCSPSRLKSLLSANGYRAMEGSTPCAPAKSTEPSLTSVWGSKCK
jgi:hypothetical protein